MSLNDIKIPKIVRNFSPEIEVEGVKSEELDEIISEKNDFLNQLVNRSIITATEKEYITKSFCVCEEDSIDGCEVKPKCKGLDDSPECRNGLKALMLVLNELNAVIDESHKCSIHCHMDAREFKGKTANILALRRIMVYWPELDDLFIGIVNQKDIYEERKNFTRSYDEFEKKYILNKAEKFGEIDYDSKISLNGPPRIDRTLTANIFLALNKYGTIEFRIANATSDVNEILLFASLYDSFLTACVNSGENLAILEAFNDASDKSKRYMDRVSYLLRALYNDDNDMKKVLEERAKKFDDIQKGKVR